MTAIAIWGTIAIAATALAAVLAGVKNRDYSFWMAWSFILPPMALVLFFLPKFSGERPKRRSLDDEDKNLY